MLELSDITLTGHGTIRVRGARVHNLRHLDVDIPRQQITVITGVSGSGKSSLAFDTIHAESQRRYLETLSRGARTRSAARSRPAVDVIDGLPPTISVSQSAVTSSLRSTLASTTEILDYLRLLFARCGQAHCTRCGRVLAARTSTEIVDQILAWEDGRKVMILAPLIRDQKGEHRGVLESIAKSGFLRARVDGEVIDLAHPPKLSKSKPHRIEAIVDRITVKAGLRARLQESVELALQHGTGTCLLCSQTAETWEDQLVSNRFACVECGTSVAELEPRTLSCNSPHGACLRCRGLGVLCDENVDPEEITRRQSDLAAICPDCQGTRLNPFASGVTFRDVTLPRFLELTVQAARSVIHDWSNTANLERPDNQPRGGESSAMSKVLARTLPAIQSRLDFLLRVGADYLTLNRPSRTLSGGEFQRARLAACLGAGLVGVCHILDEPTAGLHSKDTAAMIASLRDLQQQGNTILLVEHDLDVMRQADHLIDLGPGAGIHGGQLVASGTPHEVACSNESITGRHLKTQLDNARETSPATNTQFPPGSFGWLQLAKSHLHNLRDVAARIPYRTLTAITGVSGSGKTSLVHHSLVPEVRARLESQQRQSSGKLSDSASQSMLSVGRLIEVTQAPIGRSSSSTPATYSELWDDVCQLLARTREARLRGFRASRFRFNSAAGRCEACRGRGVQRLRLKPLPDALIECSACRGTRFNAATLQVRFQGQNAADILALRVDEALALFANFARIAKVLKTFADVGLGYLQLGQAANTLSGGEAQRVKLAAELARENSTPTLFVLDEPTTGLHPDDVSRLVDLLRRLVCSEHTVVVVEHNLSLIAQADWLIDLGSDGGERGGRIVAEGSPADVIANGSGHTSDALRSFLKTSRA